MGSWATAAFVKDLKEQGSDMNWGIAPLPQLTDDDYATMGKTTGFGINKNAKNKELAYKFLDFACGKETAKKLAAIGVVPAYKDDEVMDVYFSGEGIPNDEIARKAFEPEYVSEELPLHKNVAQFDQMANEQHDLIMNGEDTPKDGLDTLAKRVKSEFE